MADLLATIAAHWDGRADTFDEEPDHGLVPLATRAAWSRRLAMWLPEPPVRVAELGCGTGSLAVLLASHGYDVTASDISPGMVAAARRKSAAAGVDVEVTLADAAAPQLPACSLDVVLIRHLVWTLPDPEAAVATWASLLRPRGRLVMVEGRWGTAAQADDQTDDAHIDHDDAAPGSRNLPWHGGVAADTLIPLLEQVFSRVQHHDLTRDDDLWGRPVADERYALIAHLD